MDIEAERSLPGKIGKYTIIRPLGKGGEGSVYLARDETLQRLVAIKQVDGCRREKGESMEPEESIGMMREADYLQRLKHPMLPVVYDLLWYDTWYLVMEYIQGAALHEYVERNGYAREETALLWAEQILDILEYLHTRKPPVIYRDLKPGNIMVCPDGHLRLVDFGAASQRKFGDKITDIMAVTPGYGAPEQSGCMDYVMQGGQAGKPAYGQTGKEAYSDERSDIYAFGKVLYYIVTGADPAKPPYTTLPVRDYQPLLHNRFEKIIRRCIRDDPEQRYQVVEEIRRDLNKCGKRSGRLRRRSFVRMVEKRVWLTEK